MMLLALALFAAQEAEPVWARIGEVEGALVEVADVRPEGDRRRFSVRITALNSNKAAVGTIVVDCKALTSWMEGDAKVYVDGKYVETRTAPSSVSVERPVEGNPVAEAVLDYACGPAGNAK